MIDRDDLIGVGCDLVEIGRIRNSWEGYGDRFLSKVLTDGEKEIFHRKNQSMEFLAGRFAVKEAAAKALGLGLRKHVNMRHFNCLESAEGKPILSLDDFVVAAYNNHCRKGATVVQSARACASISHTKELAQGFVILFAVYE